MDRPFTFCLCADDYAMTPGVSRGILEALEAGALTATSVMTTSPWWADSADALKKYDGRADLGLHLNLTLGAPLAAMRAFAPDGHLPGIRQVMRMAREGTLPADEVAAEIDRQCQRFVDVFGRPPDHVDGHQHVHVLAPIRPLLLDALERRGWHPWLRDSADRLARILARRSTIVKAMGLTMLGRGWSRTTHARDFKTNDGFAGFSSFDSSMDYSSLFERFLKSPGRSHLVMCHPGHVDDALRRLDPVVETREQELAFLLSPRFRDLLASRKARLVRLSEMPI